jgi:hypothetical protein
MKKQFDAYLPCFIIKDAIMNTSRKVYVEPNGNCVFGTTSTEYIAEEPEERVVNLKQK